MNIFSVDVNVQIPGAPMMDPTPKMPVNVDLSHPEIPLQFLVDLKNPFGMPLNMGNLSFDIFLDSDQAGQVINTISTPTHMGTIKLPNDSLTLEPFSGSLYPFSLFLDLVTYQSGSLIGTVLNAAEHNQSLSDFVKGQVDISLNAPKENTDPFETTLDIHTNQIRPILSSLHAENVQISNLDFIFNLNLSQTEFFFDVALKFLNPFGTQMIARKLDFRVYLLYKQQYYLAAVSDFADGYANWTMEPNTESQFVMRVKAHRENVDNGVLLNVAGVSIALHNGSVDGYATGSVEAESGGLSGHASFKQSNLNARLLEMRFEDGVILNGTIKIIGTDSDDDPNPPVYVDSDMLFQNPLGAILNITHVSVDVSILDIRPPKINSSNGAEGNWVYCMTVERYFDPVWVIPGNSFKNFVTRVNMTTDDFNKREIGLISMSTFLAYGYVPARIHANITLQMEDGLTLQIPYYHPYLPIYPRFN